MTRRAPTLAVVDLGSTFAKGALFTADGRLLDAESLSVPRQVDGNSVTYDAEELARVMESLLRRLLAAGPVDAIGLTCQRSTCLLWDRLSSRALTPALSWQDATATDMVQKLGEHAQQVVNRTGLQLSPYYAAPKLRRLLDSHPAFRPRAEAGELLAGTLDAFLVHRLTGRPSTEPGHAGRTLLYNLEADTWDPTLCELFGIPLQVLPDLQESLAHRGAWQGLPVTAVTGDQQAALLAHGGGDEGVMAAHFGTGAFVLTGTGCCLRRHRGLLSAVLVSTPDGRRFQLEGSVNSAGSAMDWISGVTGLGPGQWGRPPLDPESLPRVLPALSGLAAPWWRPEVRTVVEQVGGRTSPLQLANGVLVGVAMRVVDCVEALIEAGAPADRMRLSGKLTRSRGLVNLLADLAQLRVEVSKQEEPGLAGLARLAAAGLEPDLVSLGGGIPIAYSRGPQWTPERAASARSDWKAFVNKVLGS
jgi:glycerol kinase